MKDISVATHLKSLTPSLNQTQPKNNSGFGDMLSDAIKETNDTQLKADQAVSDLATGKADNIHEVMLSMEEADISMRMLVQMRNKVVDAYQEIIRMQV
ncbi:MAG: flagellar hook-basal body complex protein FliE [Desulfobacteraceae bacterium 4572_35.1]|nr:MAG: flagellar hook-basal body complex protein FliE [Desulfobacteraceae bacterium 4572_35.1]